MFFRWVNEPLLAIVNNHIVEYPTPKNISYFWGFGILAGIILVVQILTGIFLAMHYTPHVHYAFVSVEHIIRDVSYGWLLRYLHANGASFFFIVVYLHMFRGLYYGSFLYPRGHLWCSGVLLFILIIATAFIGYVLPWGQMSFWGATVITNLISAIPFIGESIVQWLWGGFSVDNPTLNRFFSLHYILPILIAALALVHIVLLHKVGSNNPLGLCTYNENISFYPYFYVKDLYGFIVLFALFSFFVFFFPNILGHPDNYISANPISTPAHIVPEWYFLPFYAILRSIPHKLGGVVAMFGALLVLMLLPYISSAEVRAACFKPFYKFFFWLFLVNCFILGWIGQNVVEYPFVEIGQIATIFYFFFLLVFIPFIGRFESYLIRCLFIYGIWRKVGIAVTLGVKGCMFKSYCSEALYFYFMEFFFFYLFSSLLFFCCLNVVFATKAIHSVFFLVLSFCNATALLFLLEIEFFALLLLVVYVGAIAVLFLFIVMILNTKDNSSVFLVSDVNKYLPISFFFSFFFFTEIFFVFSNQLHVVTNNVGFFEYYVFFIFALDFIEKINVFGQVLFNFYFFFILVAGLLLLVAIVGSIVLTLKKKISKKSNRVYPMFRQQVYQQLSRNANNAVFLELLNLLFIKNGLFG